MDEVSLYLTPLSNNLEQLRVISQNVANLNTEGYNAQSFIQSVEGEQSLVHKLDGHSLRETGKPLQFAIKGEAFFLVRKDDALYITKNGSFFIDEQQELSHISGAKLLIDGGPVSVSGTSLSVSENGEVSEAGQVLGKLNLVAPTRNSELRPVGSGLYQLVRGGLNEVDAKVIQGAVNTSNVDPAHEMTRLLKLTRHTESLQKAAQTYHQVLSMGISDIGGN